MYSAKVVHSCMIHQHSTYQVHTSMYQVHTTSHDSRMKNIRMCLSSPLLLHVPCCQAQVEPCCPWPCWFGPVESESAQPSRSSIACDSDHTQYRHSLPVLSMISITWPHGPLQGPRTAWPDARQHLVVWPVSLSLAPGPEQDEGADRYSTQGLAGWQSDGASTAEQVGRGPAVLRRAAAQACVADSQD